MKYIFVLLFAFIAWCIVLAVVEIPLQSECLSRGYREAKIDFFFNRYCITRSDQTDIVVPLEYAYRRR